MDDIDRQYTLIRLDIYRDGGSLSMTFLNQAHQEWTLLFPIHSLNNLRDKYLTFDLPQLIRYITIEQVSPVTGSVYDLADKYTEETDWATAREIIAFATVSDELFTHFPRWIYQDMTIIAKNEGKILNKLSAKKMKSLTEDKITVYWHKTRVGTVINPTFDFPHYYGKWSVWPEPIGHQFLEALRFALSDEGDGGLEVLYQYNQNDSLSEGSIGIHPDDNDGYIDIRIR